MKNGLKKLWFALIVLGVGLCIGKKGNRVNTHGDTICLARLAKDNLNR